MEDSFCISVLERALRLFPRPDIFNTDQGAQFTGNSFTGVLQSSRDQNQYGQILAPAISAFPTSLWVTVKGKPWIISS